MKNALFMGINSKRESDDDSDDEKKIGAPSSVTAEPEMNLLDMDSGAQEQNLLDVGPSSGNLLDDVFNSGPSSSQPS